MMRAFHGNQETKDKYLGRVKAHRIADEIIKGKYWENGKGCAAKAFAPTNATKSDAQVSA